MGAEEEGEERRMEREIMVGEERVGREIRDCKKGCERKAAKMRIKV